MTDMERKRMRYRANPEYRDRRIRAVTERHKANAADPDYRRLVQLRKDIHRIRDSYEARMAHATRLSERLVKLGRELVRVQARWDAKEEKARG